MRSQEITEHAVQARKCPATQPETMLARRHSGEVELICSHDPVLLGGRC